MITSIIKHREETRGIGGIFYDRLKPENTKLSYEQLLEFSLEVGRTFSPDLYRTH